MPRRIFVNTRVLNFHTTGAQRFLIEMLRRLAPTVEEIRPSKPIAGVLGHAWEQSILPCLVGRGVLWSPTNTGPLAVARQVVNIHDVVPLDHPEWLNPHFARLHRWLIPRIARRAARIITGSEFTRRRIIERTGVSADKINVVYDGVDSRFRPQSQPEIEAAREALRLPAGRYILSLGAIEPRKNLPRLLRAWAAALPCLPSDVWLVIAGAPGRSLVFKQVPFGAIPERVHLTGYVPDEHLPGLYAGALAFTYLSIYEGFGLPPLEAMACGTPVITGNRTSLPEVVGNGGIMIDPFDLDQIADTIVKVVLSFDLRRTLSAKGRERSRHFSWQKASEATLRILSEVAA